MCTKLSAVKSAKSSPLSDNLGLFLYFGSAYADFLFIYLNFSNQAIFSCLAKYP